MLPAKKMLDTKLDKDKLFYITDCIHVCLE